MAKEWRTSETGDGIHNLTELSFMRSEFYVKRLFTSETDEDTVQWTQHYRSMPHTLFLWFDSGAQQHASWVSSRLEDNKEIGTI